MEVWIVYHHAGSLIGNKLVNSDGNDWTKWERLEHGQVWLRDGLEYKLSCMADDTITFSWSDGGMLPAYDTVSWALFLESFELKDEGCDDPSYTEGYRLGYTGLRWL
jgi:hypothetical protein